MKKYLALTLLTCITLSQATEFEQKSFSGNSCNEMLLGGLKRGVIGGIVTAGCWLALAAGVSFFDERSSDPVEIMFEPIAQYSTAAIAGVCFLSGIKNRAKKTFEFRYNDAVSCISKLQNNMMFTFSETPQDLLYGLRHHYIGFKRPLRIAQKDLDALRKQAIQTRNELRKVLQKPWVADVDRADASAVIDVLQTYIKEMFRMLKVVKNSKQYRR